MNMRETKKNGKRLTGTLAVVLTLVVMVCSAFPNIVSHAEGKDRSQNTPVRITVPDNKVPVYQYGKSQDFILNIENTGDSEITNLVIQPELRGDDSSRWPFKTDYQKYSATVKSLKKKGEKGNHAQVKFSFTQRDDAGANRYLLSFSYTADQIDEGTVSFYVNTSKKPEDKNTGASGGGNSSSGKADSDSAAGMAGGSVSNGAALYSDFGGGDVGAVSAGGAAEGAADGSVPRVIVTGFTTDPVEVKAGSDFTLTIHLKNTSKKSKVGNMLFDLNAPVEGADEQTTAPAFLPASGSSTVYLESIKAGGTADISMKLNAKSDLLQKPYSVELSMKYEDAGFNQIEATSSLSIPVKQDARFEFSDFQISPESIAVGEEANVMCSLYNLGRLKLYNVKAVFEGDSIEKEELFVGNVEPGSTASIDAMVKGKKETADDGKLTMTMSYENEEGEVFTEQKEFQLMVMPEETPEDMDVMMPEEEEPGKGLPFPLIVVLVLLVVGAVVTVIVLKQRKKKKDKDEEEELLYELDGTSEDEQQ